MHPDRPCTQCGPAIAFHDNQGRGLQRRAIIRWTVSMWWPPPLSGRMDSGIRGQWACCGNRWLRETGGTELSKKGRAWWGVWCVWEAEGWADMRAGGRVNRKILTTGW